MERINRRDALKIGAAVTVLNLLGRQERRVSALEKLPTELPPTVLFLGGEGVHVQPGVIWDVRRNLGPGAIEVLTTQNVRIPQAGNAFEFEGVGSGRVIVFVNTHHGSPERPIGYQVAGGSSPQGTDFWHGREEITRLDNERPWQKVVEDAVSAAKLQARRMMDRGNCTPEGCSRVNVHVLSIRRRDGALERLFLGSFTRANL